MNIDYKCKFCGCPGVAQTEDPLKPNDPGTAEMFRFERWVEMLCCNRCADYMESKRVARDIVKRLAYKLVAARLNHPLTEDKNKSEALQEIEARVFEGLIKVTKHIATIVCGHYRVTNVWEEEFPKLIMDHPDECDNIVNRYVRDVGRIKREMEVATRELPPGDRE